MNPIKFFVLRLRLLRCKTAKERTAVRRSVGQQYRKPKVVAPPHSQSEVAAPQVEGTAKTSSAAKKGH